MLKPRIKAIFVLLLATIVIMAVTVKNTPPVTAAITLKKIFSARIFLRLDAFPSRFSEYALKRL